MYFGILVPGTLHYRRIIITTVNVYKLHLEYQRKLLLTLRKGSSQTFTESSHVALTFVVKSEFIE